MPAPLPLTRDILLIGGGHAHALVLRMWAMDPLPGARITLVNPGPVAPYTGMLPGAIAGHYARSEMMIDLVRLARAAGARLILGRVAGLDSVARQATLDDGRRQRYDVASVDIGISSDLPEVARRGRTCRLRQALGRLCRAMEAFLAAAPSVPRLVVIGAGVGGVELALASVHRLRTLGRKPEVTLIDRDATPLQGLGDAARRALLEACAESGIVC